MLLYGGIVGVLAMESQCKGTNTPSLRNSGVVDEETLRGGHWLGVKCFDSWMGDRKDIWLIQDQY